MFNNIQINQKTITNGRQLIRVEEGIDYVADCRDWYLKTEDKEDTNYCADDWIEFKKAGDDGVTISKQVLLTNWVS
jgi:hypothetical protein